MIFRLFIILYQYAQFKLHSEHILSNIHKFIMFCLPQNMISKTQEHINTLL